MNEHDQTRASGKAHLAALRWKNPAPGGCERDSEVWIDVARLDAAWQASDSYIGRGGTGDAIAGRYEKFGNWVIGKDRVIEMPTICIDNGILEFTDGRHRFAWLRDHGVKHIPVAVDPDSLSQVSVQFWSNEGDEND